MELRWYQREAIDHAWGYLASNQGNPLVVLPTGAGKSIVIASLVERTVNLGRRVLALAHRKELLEQNAAEIKRLLPSVPVGIYSAGLGERETDADVICGGIQSIFRKAGELGARHLVLIDEAHLVNVNDVGMYRKFLEDLREINPKCRVIGLTATPYRTDDGPLVDDGSIFDAIAYEADVARLINDGFLCHILSAEAEESVDTSGLKIRAGEFVTADMEAAFSQSEVVSAACAEIVGKASGRKSILVFCCGVAHAQAVQYMLEQMTRERVGLVTGNTMQLERAALLQDFKAGNLRWLVNVDVLTTGFNAPNVDAIAVLRATCSPGLFAQICGRGFRLHPGKENCLILDFGENIERHGPLDSKDYGKRKKKKEGKGNAPQKACEKCQETIPAAARICPECGAVQTIEVDDRHGDKAADAPLLQSQMEPVEWQVDEVNMREHTNKKTGSRTLRVDYQCKPDGLNDGIPQTISEWVCIEHEGFAGRKAGDWWARRSKVKVSTILEAIDVWKRLGVAETRAITTIPDGKFTRIVEYMLGPVPALEDLIEDGPSRWATERGIRFEESDNHLRWYFGDDFAEYWPSSERFAFNGNYSEGWYMGSVEQVQEWLAGAWCIGAGVANDFGEDLPF